MQTSCACLGSVVALMPMRCAFAQDVEHAGSVRNACSAPSADESVVRVLDVAAYQQMTGLGWSADGIVMCAAN